MAEHIAKPEIERFSVSALPEPRLETIAKHLAECEACHMVLSETLRHQRGTEGLKFTLAPEFWFRHDHLDYEQLVGIAENKLDATEREIIDVHLSTCATCREDVSSFLAFCKQIEPELRVRYGPAAKEPKPSTVSLPNWRRGLAWKPAYTAAVILIGIALVIGVALLLKRRGANLEARHAQPPQTNIGVPRQTPTPENQAVNIQRTPAPVPSEQYAASPSSTIKNREPIRKPENAGVVVALSDGQRTVTVNREGGVSGLENIPAETQRDVAKTLVAQRWSAIQITISRKSGYPD